jgi:hypothetical protein
MFPLNREGAKARRTFELEASWHLGDFAVKKASSALRATALRSVRERAYAGA